MALQKAPVKAMATIDATQWVIIVNPAAGGGAVRKQWPGLEAALRTALPVAQVCFTEYPKHALELVRKAVEAGCRKVIAVGGDGTNHEVTNGILMQDIVPPREITYALLPVGTGNDWARMYGIPKNLKTWLMMVQQGQTRLQDVGVAEYDDDRGQRTLRYFVNVAGMAFDAFLVHDVASRRSWLAGRFYYLLMIVWCSFKYRHVKSGVQHDDFREEKYYYSINVGICKYSGGGIQMVPHAKPDDGLLALTLVGRVNKIGVLLATRRFYNGTISRHPKVRVAQTKSILVEPAGPEPVLLEADGEFLGQAPVRFSLLENALRLVTPAQSGVQEHQ